MKHEPWLDPNSTSRPSLQPVWLPAPRAANRAVPLAPAVHEAHNINIGHCWLSEFKLVGSQARHFVSQSQTRPVINHKSTETVNVDMPVA